MRPMFVCVHVGAGYHAPDREQKYVRCMQQAVQNALDEARSGGSALDAVVAAICSLEVMPMGIWCACVAE